MPPASRTHARVHQPAEVEAAVEVLIRGNPCANAAAAPELRGGDAAQQGDDEECGGGEAAALGIMGGYTTVPAPLKRRL